MVRTKGAMRKMNSGRVFRRRHAKPLNKLQKAQVKRIVTKKSEPKHYDFAQASIQVDRGGVGPTLLSTIPQGAAQSQRVGDELTATSLEYNFDLYYTNGVTLAGHSARLIIFKWNIDTAITTPALGSIVQVAGTINEINSPYDWNAKRQKDFTILYDKVFGLFQGKSEVRRLRIPLRAHRIAFEPGTTAAEGHIYSLWIGDDATGAHTPDVSVQYQTRLVYHDG